MKNGSLLTRRNFVSSTIGVTGLALAGCTSRSKIPDASQQVPIRRAYAAMYAAQPEERFPLPAIELDKIPAKYLRRLVTYETNEPAGTIVVDTQNFHLYHVEAGGKSMRYGVGLGRAGFEWSGRGHIAWKQEWPKWTPPDEMIARQPELEKFSVRNGGMPPGLENPLGSRALYIFQGKEDTLYRIHGSPEFWTIGKEVSSGCVRMINQDVIDLYSRVKTKSKIIVL